MSGVRETPRQFVARPLDLIEVGEHRQFGADRTAYVWVKSSASLWPGASRYLRLVAIDEYGRVHSTGVKPRQWHDAAPWPRRGG